MEKMNEELIKKLKNLNIKKDKNIEAFTNIYIKETRTLMKKYETLKELRGREKADEMLTDIIYGILIGGNNNIDESLHSFNKVMKQVKQNICSADALINK